MSIAPESSIPAAAVDARQSRVRKMRLPFGDDIPKHWFAGNPVATHLANGVNLLFPAGERFFVRSVKHYLDRFADDPEMTERIRVFFGQEGNHAREHERFFAIMEAQGYDIDQFVARYQDISYRVLEKRMPPQVRLAITAACEHFTAILAEIALENDFLSAAHPVMADLLKWHAAEEIEHKAVAYDVLQRVAPSYAIRVTGLLLASLMLGSWWFRATRRLLAQDGLDRRTVRRHARSMNEARSAQMKDGKPGILRNVFWKGIRSYLRPGFHPDQSDNYHLAKRYLARIDQPAGEAA